MGALLLAAAMSACGNDAPCNHVINDVARFEDCQAIAVERNCSFQVTYSNKNKRCKVENCGDCNGGAATPTETPAATATRTPLVATPTRTSAPATPTTTPAGATPTGTPVGATPTGTPVATDTGTPDATPTTTPQGATPTDTPEVTATGTPEATATTTPQG